jgi:threonyl-tRNA synthetase
MLIVGQKEQESGSLAVRLHGKGDQGVKPRAQVVAEILDSIRSREK